MMSDTAMVVEVSSGIPYCLTPPRTTLPFYESPMSQIWSNLFMRALSSQPLGRVGPLADEELDLDRMGLPLATLPVPDFGAP